jgi:ABC-type nitrate/sulfonate/bicarbonate transport system substrate-binding protein
MRPLLHKILLSFGLVVLALTLACRSRSSLQEIRLAKGMSPINLLFEVASQEQLWEQHGFSVEVSTFQSARHVLDAVIGTSFDVGVGADTPLLLALHQGYGIKMVSNMVTSDKHVGLILRSSSLKPTCEGLSGKRIALMRGTLQEFFFDQFLGGSAVACGVEVVNLAPVEAVSAFRAGGDLSGVVVWEPQMSLALEGSTDGERVYYGAHVHAFGIIYGKESKMRDPELRGRFLKVMESALTWATMHPDTVIEILARTQNVSRDRAEVLRQMYTFELGRRDIMLDSLVAQQPWALARGFIKEALTREALEGLIQ